MSKMSTNVFQTQCVDMGNHKSHNPLWFFQQYISKGCYQITRFWPFEEDHNMYCSQRNRLRCHDDNNGGASLSLIYKHIYISICMTKSCHFFCFSNDHHEKMFHWFRCWLMTYHVNKFRVMSNLHAVIFLLQYILKIFLCSIDKL